MSESTPPTTTQAFSSAGDYFLRSIALLMFALVVASIAGAAQVFLGRSAEAWPAIIGGVIVVGLIVMAANAYVDGKSRLR